MMSKFRDPEYYEYRAEESRVIANCMTEPFTREAMFKVSEDYVRMAEMMRQSLPYLKTSNVGVT